MRKTTHSIRATYESLLREMMLQSSDAFKKTGYDLVEIASDKGKTMRKNTHSIRATYESLVREMMLQSSDAFKKTEYDLVEIRDGATAMSKNMAANPMFANAVVSGALTAVADHGLDPCTRRQAAAHEAGHCLILCLLGSTIDKVEINVRNLMGLKLWLGVTTSHDRDRLMVFDEQNRAHLALQTDVALFAAAANSFAGAMGEHAENLLHPASSLDEIAMAQSCSVVLADRHHLPPQEVATHIQAWVFDSIKRSKAQHHHLTSALAKNKKLSGKVAHSLLMSVPRTNAQVALTTVLHTMKTKKGVA